MKASEAFSYGYLCESETLIDNFFGLCYNNEDEPVYDRLSLEEYDKRATAAVKKHKMKVSMW